MNKKHWIFSCFISVALINLFLAGQINAQELPSDKKATKETIALFNNLKKLAPKGFMFGHQDDLAYGVNWKYEEERSDIRDVTGDYPAVYGWELGHLEIDANKTNLDSVPFDRMKQFIRQGYKRGAVITISWHLNNPLTGKSAWNPAEGTVASILPYGSKHEFFKTWLDKLAAFLNGLKGEKGELIPVIFRPYHELNGSWFWWGKNHCTPDEFKKLWRFTVGYLRNEKQLHHLLVAFNTDQFGSIDEYLDRYPGDEWVDIIGFDIYQREKARDIYMKDFDRMLTQLETIAEQKKKIPALTEFGGNIYNDSTWWTKTFYPVLAKHKISYVLGWRNAGAKREGGFEYYVPYKDQRSAVDFVEFYNLDKTFFGKDILKRKIYE